MHLWDRANSFNKTIFQTGSDELTGSGNLPLPIEMQLSEKPKTFFKFFIAFLESTLNFEHFETEMSLIA